MSEAWVVIADTSSDATASAVRTADVSRPVAILIGAPGAGKSTVGAALAEALGVAFRDTDSDIEQAAGKSVSDIFFDDGEDHFRTLEAAAVAVALAEHDGVLALGGGSILDQRTRVLLSGHRVIWLRVDVPAAASRVGLARDRPMLSMNPRGHLRQLLAERAPLYAEVATITADTVDRAPDAVVAELIDILRARRL